MVYQLEVCYFSREPTWTNVLTRILEKTNFSFYCIQGQNELFEVNEVVVVSIKEPENEMNISLKDIIYVSA